MLILICSQSQSKDDSMGLKEVAYEYFKGFVP